MPDTLPQLIDKQDGFEVVRDQVAVLLAENTTTQVALAAAVPKPDPELWRFRVYLERSNPWESFRDGNAQFAASPIVNVSYQGDEFPRDQGDTIERQAAAGRIAIDCYGLGKAADIAAGGHVPGDLDAVLEAQRCMRLVRNILMAAQNAWLQLQEIDTPAPAPAVWQRWIASRQFFEPDTGDSALQVVGFRLMLEVTFNEFSPQHSLDNLLEFVAVDIQRAEDGAVLGGAHFDYTV